MQSKLDEELVALASKKGIEEVSFFEVLRFIMAKIKESAEETVSKLTEEEKIAFLEDLKKSE